MNCKIQRCVCNRFLENFNIPQLYFLHSIIPIKKTFTIFYKRAYYIIVLIYSWFYVYVSDINFEYHLSVHIFHLGSTQTTISSGTSVLLRWSKKKQYNKKCHHGNELTYLYPQQTRETVTWQPNIFTSYVHI